MPRINEYDLPSNIVPILADIVAPLPIKSCVVVKTIKQGNASGKLIRLHHESHHHGNSDEEVVCSNNGGVSSPPPPIGTITRTTTELFIKEVSAKTYAYKSWIDLRRTLLYARTEYRFYSEFLPLLHTENGSSSRSTASTLAPKCYYSAINLHDYIPDHECATSQSSITEAPIITDLVNGNGDESSSSGTMMLVLASVPNYAYYQESPLTASQTKQCLSAAAKLHASSWEKKEVLSHAAERLSLGSYHLDTRNPTELDNMISSWDKFRTSFASEIEHDENYSILFDRPSVLDIGKRMQSMARYISNQLSPSSNDRYATLVHGDLKAMNLFLPIADTETKPKNIHHGTDAMIIDFASTGVGFGMSDISMLLIHSMRPSERNEETLISYYLGELEHYYHLTRTISSNVDATKEEEQQQKQHCFFDKEIAMRHYRLGVVDYFRFVLGRFWKSASPKTFNDKRENKNVTFVNRDLDAAMALIDIVDSYLLGFEAEKRHNEEEKLDR